MQVEDETSAIDIGLVCAENSLVVNSSHPIPSEVQSSTTPGTCEHVITSIEKEQTSYDRDSRRVMIHGIDVCTSAKAQEAWYSAFQDSQNHKMVDDSI